MYYFKEAARFIAFVLLFILIAEIVQGGLGALFVFSSTYEQPELNDVVIQELESGRSRLWQWLRVIRASFTEEMACRGVSFWLILRSNFRRDVIIATCVVSSALFGILHGVDLFNLVVKGGAGVVLFIAGYTYLKRNNIYAAVLMSSLVHLGVNSLWLIAMLSVYG